MCVLHVHTEDISFKILIFSLRKNQSFTRTRLRLISPEFKFLQFLFGSSRGFSGYDTPMVSS